MQIENVCVKPKTKFQSVGANNKVDMGTSTKVGAKKSILVVSSQEKNRVSKRLFSIRG